MAEQSGLGNYSPEDVIMIISNDTFSHTISGVADGTFISYEREVPRATLYVGADLSAARVLRRNKSGTVSLTLSQHGESNDFLSQLARRDEESQDNSWLFAVTIKDLRGRTQFYSPQAFIGNDPNITFGVDTETRDWTITVTGIENHIGGDGQFAPTVQADLESIGYTVEDKWKMNQPVQG